MESWPRIIVHADMDAFYAAVEQLDDPTLRGKPVLIGPNNRRGVVLTASYEARPYGVGSAMPVSEARRRCPRAVLVAPRLARYEEVSRQVMAVLGDFSPAVEPLSLDEAFLDMSGAEHLFGAPLAMGRRIKAAVLAATGLHISVGVAGTKYVAKVASAHEKPNGLTVVSAAQSVAWLAPQSISRLWGVGRKTAAKLNRLGFHTIADIAAATEMELHDALGSAGTHFYKLAHGFDPRPVRRGRMARSIGSDRTLNEDVGDRATIEMHLRRAAERIARRMRGKNYVANGIRVRLKTSRFEMLSRQQHLARGDDTAEGFFTTAKQLLDRFEHPGPFRLIGVTAFDLQWRDQSKQADLFDDPNQRRLETTIDELLERFGSNALTRATDLAGRGTVADSGVTLDFLDYRDGERVSVPG